MYAIIVTGGKQYKVSEGSTIFVEKLNAEPEQEVVFDEVLAVSKGDDEVVFGTPKVEGVSVIARVLKNGKGKKIRIIKHKPKKGYMKRQGHRQPYTQVVIEKINA
jgi:large subunit ribosomal protein L21